MNGLASVAAFAVLIVVVLFVDIMTLVEQRRRVDVVLELDLFSKLALAVMNIVAFVAMGQVIHLSCF